jgi:hypothetical protein
MQVSEDKTQRTQRNQEPLNHSGKEGGDRENTFIESISLKF